MAEETQQSMTEEIPSPTTGDRIIGMLRRLGYDARSNFYGMPENDPKWEITELIIFDNRIKGGPWVAKYRFEFGKKEKGIIINEMELNAAYEGRDTYNTLEEFCSDNGILYDTL